MNCRIRLVILVLFPFVLLSCVKNETEKVNLNSDENFFPLKIGQVRVYQVDSILFRQGKLLDSTVSYVKEEITKLVKDTLGEEFIVLKSYRKKLTDTWQPLASYTARLYQNKAIRNEGNINIIPLVFPISSQLTWNGLAFLNEDQEFNVAGESVQVFQGWESFKINDLPKAEKVGAFNFDQVLTVLQSDEEDIINKRYSLEKYVSGVGLAFRTMIILDCNSNINNCIPSIPWEKRATKGFILKQTLLDFK